MLLIWILNSVGAKRATRVSIYACFFVYACLLLLDVLCNFSPRTVAAHISSCAVLSWAIFKARSLQRTASPLPHFLKCLCSNVNPTLGKAPFVFCFFSPSWVPLLWWTEAASQWNVCHNKNISHRLGNSFGRPCVCIIGKQRETHWDVICAVLAWFRLAKSARKSFSTFLFCCCCSLSWLTWIWLHIFNNL